MQDFLIWLNGHEDDITNDINDFGELKEVFNELMQRKAGEPIAKSPMW